MERKLTEKDYKQFLANHARNEKFNPNSAQSEKAYDYRIMHPTMAALEQHNHAAYKFKEFTDEKRGMENQEMKIRRFESDY